MRISYTKININTYLLLIIIIMHNMKEYGGMEVKLYILMGVSG
jgi:hypothetical protein